MVQGLSMAQKQVTPNIICVMAQSRNGPAVFQPGHRIQGTHLAAAALAERAQELKAEARRG